MLRAWICVPIFCLAMAACERPQEPAHSNTASVPPQTSHRGANVGDCIDVTVGSVGSRLQGMPNSGSAILYTDGMSQVSYDAIPGIDHSKAGDSVHLCLVSVPQHCPPGDDRGKVYAATNARTGETWSAPDSEHACGGA